MSWSVYLWKCENIILLHILVKIYHVGTPSSDKQHDSENAAVAQQHTATYSWTFIKSQSVVSRGMDHSWLIFPSVIVGSNYNIIGKLLWSLGYTLDCKNQTSEDQWQHKPSVTKAIPFCGNWNDLLPGRRLNCGTYLGQHDIFKSDFLLFLFKSIIVQKPATLNCNEECPDVKSHRATSQF